MMLLRVVANLKSSNRTFMELKHVNTIYFFFFIFTF